MQVRRVNSQRKDLCRGGCFFLKAFSVCFSSDVGSKYCCIIVDEAHERTVNLDLLLGLLSRVVVLRRQRFLKGEDGLPPLKYGLCLRLFQPL